MSPRKILKKMVYGYCPGFSGAVPYFGTRVFFPRHAYIFDLLCQEGVYERELLRQIQGVLRPGDWYFDVGANVGLLSVPVLGSTRDIRVLSLEPSPNSSPYLEKTWAQCPWKERWKIVSKAAGDRVGETEFAVSAPKFGGYDGIEHTGRVSNVGKIRVSVTTLDAEWEALGRPRVGCVKLDIEGAEIKALVGARQLIQSMRPHIFLEWYRENFEAFGHKAEHLFEAACEFNYELVAMPTLNAINSLAAFRLQTQVSSYFAFVPRS